MTKQKKIVVDYLVVLLFVLTSGSKLWIASLSPAFAFIFFFIISFTYKCTLGLRGNNKSLVFVYIVSAIMLIGHFYYNRELKENSTFGYVVSLLSTYCLVSAFDFYKFRKILLDIVFFITLFGIPIFFLNENNILPTTLSHFVDADYKHFGPYMLGWPYEFHRYAGIWHEPGAGQIILNIVLWLHLDKFINIDFQKGELFKFIVLIIGVIISFSTGGYLVFMLFVMVLAINIKLEGNYKLLIYSVVVVCAVLFAVILFNSEVIQDKIFNKNSGSLNARTADVSAFYDMFLNRPILGYGLGSTEFWRTSVKLGNTANSCGVMTFAAALGIIWLISFVLYTYSGIMNMVKTKLICFFSLFAFMMLQWNECFIEFPITNMFIFTFGSYQLKWNQP